MLCFRNFFRHFCSSGQSNIFHCFARLKTVGEKISDEGLLSFNQNGEEIEYRQWYLHQSLKLEAQVWGKVK